MITMTHVIVGLGNPGKEYGETRHNAGRIAVERWRRARGWPDWRRDDKLVALVSEGRVGQEKVLLLLPETMMNNSGRSLKTLVRNRAQAARLLVVHDDLDLPLGSFKLSWNRGAGGHRGLESIIRQIKTREFNRIRIGISPKKKPSGEKTVLAHILGRWKPAERKIIDRLGKKIAAAAETLISEGRARAMNIFNS